MFCQLKQFSETVKVCPSCGGRGNQANYTLQRLEYCSLCKGAGYVSTEWELKPSPQEKKMEAKLCKDCRWFEVSKVVGAYNYSTPVTIKCTYPQIPVELVYGNPISTDPALLRSAFSQINPKCGPEAKWFEPKEETP